MTIELDYLGKAPRKKGINSKVKGNKNELTLAKALSSYTGLEFVRVPQSGGLRWENAATVIGDLIVTNADAVFPFAVETKHLKTLALQKSGLLRTKSKIYGLFEQAARDGLRADKIPSLWVRGNGMPAGTWWVFIPTPIYFKLKDVLINYVGVLQYGEGIIGINSKELFAAPWEQVVTLLT
jgi:hypothetical protein